MYPTKFKRNHLAPELCTGCRACEQACEFNAIVMELDREGFLYPVHHEQNCIECGLCEQACPMIEVLPHEHKQPLKVFASWIKNPNLRMQATSGGMFMAIASKVIEQNGVIFGAAYDEEFNLFHSKAETLSKCLTFTGSKYAQSDPRNTFSEVRQLLKAGRRVYYTGTPCQIAGLRKFLRKDYENLLTSDIICHGTPSNLLFKQEIEWKEKQRDKKIVALSYRCKDRFGWGYDCKVEWDDGEIEYQDAWESPYFAGFWKNTTLRPSCYSCKFASIKRQGDITLGDFWGVKKHVKEIKLTGKGVSMLLVNSQKGLDVLDSINNIDRIESDVKTALKIQAHLSRPVNRPESREGIYIHAYESDFEVFAKTKLLYGRKAKMKRQIRNLVKLTVLWKHWK